MLHFSPPLGRDPQTLPDRSILQSPESPGSGKEHIMNIFTTTPVPRFPVLRQRARLTSGERLERALLALAQAGVDQAGGDGAHLLRHREMPWSSATFAGARHVFVLVFAGTSACAHAEQLIATLPDHDFMLPGALVAETAITRVDHRQCPEARIEIELAVLLLDRD